MERLTLKDRFRATLGEAGVVLYFLLGLAINIFPFVMIDGNWFLKIVLVLVDACFPSLSVIFWTWGLISTINSPQNAWSVIYYIAYAVVCIPTVITFILDLIQWIYAKTHSRDY